MPVAEILLTPLVSVLYQNLTSEALLKLARLKGIDSELKKWTAALPQIKAALVDAGQRQIMDRAVHLWLNQLEDLAYDIDDVLDDLATEVARRRVMENPKLIATKVRKLLPSFLPSVTLATLKFDHKMIRKLDKITNGLQNLAELKNSLGLRDNVETLPYRMNDRFPTTSLVEEAFIKGRETDKEAVLGLLLQDEFCCRNTNSAVIIPIVGMGGIGKTTLAQLVYNDDVVKKHFKLMAWVCVSDDFDVVMITKIIIESVTQEKFKFNDLNMLQVALKEKLSGKMFLIVLDDVWNEKDKKWELLLHPFKGAAPGSRIIVTTRNNQVVSKMGFSDPYRLELLEDDKSLSLFAQHALGVDSFDGHARFKLIGESLVRKCKGLPLALKTLGRLLWTKRTTDEWEELLMSEIWNNIPEDKNDILPALRLSYHHLPPHLKPLFAYCCLFPKDYMFDSDELVLLWMAEGFLPNSDGEKRMEDIGQNYFKEP